MSLGTLDRHQITFHPEHKMDLLCYVRVRWTRLHCTTSFFIPLSAEDASTNSFHTIFFLPRKEPGAASKYI